jgi:hypothetical protein
VRPFEEILTLREQLRDPELLEERWEELWRRLHKKIDAKYLRC